MQSLKSRLACSILVLRPGLGFADVRLVAELLPTRASRAQPEKTTSGPPLAEWTTRGQCCVWQSKANSWRWNLSIATWNVTSLSGKLSKFFWEVEAKDSWAELVLGEQNNRVPRFPRVSRRDNTKCSNWELNHGNESDTQKGKIRTNGLSLNPNSSVLVDVCACQRLSLSNSTFKHKHIHQFMLHQSTLKEVIDCLGSCTIKCCPCLESFSKERAELVTDYHLLASWIQFARENGWMDWTGLNILKIFVGNVWLKKLSEGSLTSRTSTAGRGVLWVCVDHVFHLHCYSSCLKLSSKVTGACLSRKYRMLSCWKSSTSFVGLLDSRRGW